MDWTTEYPTREGFYWVRKLIFKHRSVLNHAPEPQIVLIDEGLHFPVDELGIRRERIVSAEWYGPLEPPA